MIQTLTNAPVTVLYELIDGGSSLSRRQRERDAVAAIIRHYAGDGAILDHDMHGAPLLDGYNISVTHSRRLAAVAFDRSRVIGIDAEEWRKALYNVASRYLSGPEARIFTSQHQLLAAWTIKEAVFKATADPLLELIDISVSETMDTACASGKTYDLTSQYVAETLVTVAVLRE